MNREHLIHLLRMIADDILMGQLQGAKLDRDYRLNSAKAELKAIIDELEKEDE